MYHLNGIMGSEPALSFSYPFLFSIPKICIVDEEPHFWHFWHFWSHLVTSRSSDYLYSLFLSLGPSDHFVKFHANPPNFGNFMMEEGSNPCYHHEVLHWTNESVNWKNENHGGAQKVIRHHLHRRVWCRWSSWRYWEGTWQWTWWGATVRRTCGLQR